MRLLRGVLVYLWSTGVLAQTIVPAREIKSLGHDLGTDDIAPLWMRADSSEWVVGFARDNKSDRTQALGYWWDIFVEEDQGRNLTFSVGRDLAGSPFRLGRFGADQYQSYAAYLCWAPVPPYKRLAYIHNYREINILDVRDLGIPKPLMTLGFEVNNLCLDWSVKDRLAFVSELTGSGDIYVLDVPSTPKGKITGSEIDRYIHRLTKGMGYEGDPSWSPQGDKLAYVTQSRPGNQDIYIIDDASSALAAGGIEKGRQITSLPGAETNPSWSPDGKLLAFYRVEKDEGERVELWVVDIDGKEKPREIAGGVQRASQGRPAWVQQKESQRGYQLIYTVLDSLSNGMFLADVERREIRQVQVGVEVVSDPSTASGEYPFIAFSGHNAVGRRRIYVCRLEIEVPKMGDW